MKDLEKEVKKLSNLLPISLKPYPNEKKKDHYYIREHIYNMRILLDKYPDLNALAKSIKQKYLEDFY